MSWVSRWINCSVCRPCGGRVHAPSNKSGGSYSLGTPDLSTSRSFEPSVSERDLSSQTKRGLLDQAAPTRNRFSKKIRIENSQPELPLATMFFSGLEGKWKGQQRKKIVLKRVEEKGVDEQPTSLSSVEPHGVTNVDCLAGEAGLILPPPPGDPRHEAHGVELPRPSKASGC